MLRLAIALTLFASLFGGRATAQPCAGDCGGDGTVTVNELVQAVAIALGSAAPGACTAVDTDGNGQVTVAELIGAVNSVLNGCGAAQPTRTPTPTVLANTTPTSAIPGCNNGRVTFSYANVTGTNAITTPLELTLLAASEVRDARTGTYVWLLTALECIRNEFSLSRNVQIQIIGATSPLVAGARVELGRPGLPLQLIVYGELQDPNQFLRAWSPSSGTLEILAAEGNRITFRLSASMVPAPIASFGQQPTGTFTLTIEGTIDNVVRS